MPTTTATTERPSLADCVRERIGELHDRGVRVFTPDHFEKTAKRAGRPLPWLVDHLLVLEGVGILRGAGRCPERAWAVSAGSGYLR